MHTLLSFVLLFSQPLAARTSVVQQRVTVRRVEPVFSPTFLTAGARKCCGLAGRVKGDKGGGGGYWSGSC